MTASLKLTSVPGVGANFVEYLRRAHRIIFEEGEPSIAGRFRREAEHIVFGGESSNHRLHGARPDQIETELHRLIERTPLAELHSLRDDQVAEHMAVFLERFFKIHPFVDGNGRVGRLLLELIARYHTCGLQFRAWDSSPKGDGGTFGRSSTPIGMLLTGAIGSTGRSRIR